MLGMLAKTSGPSLVCVIFPTRPAPVASGWRRAPWPRVHHVAGRSWRTDATRPLKRWLVAVHRSGAIFEKAAPSRVLSPAQLPGKRHIRFFQLLPDNRRLTERSA